MRGVSARDRVDGQLEINPWMDACGPDFGGLDGVPSLVGSAINDGDATLPWTKYT